MSALKRRRKHLRASHDSLMEGDDDSDQLAVVIDTDAFETSTRLDGIHEMLGILSNVIGSGEISLV